MPDQREIRVFFASAGDVEEERYVFREALTSLSRRRGILYTPLGFEDALAATGRRPQEIINDLVDQCDVFVVAFHRQWGQNASDAVAYTAYTEEEFGTSHPPPNPGGSDSRSRQSAGPCLTE